MPTPVSLFQKQMEVCADVCQQIAGGEKAIIGVMVEVIWWKETRMRKRSAADLR